MPGPRLAGVEFDDQLLVDERVDFLAGRNADDGSGEFVAVHADPLRSGDGLGEIDSALAELLAAGGFFQSDDVAGFALVAGDVDLVAIHADVAVADVLPGGVAAVGESEAVNDIVETEFQHLEEDFPGHALAALGFGEEAAEGFFQHAVLVTELLLLAEGDGVIAGFLTATAGSVLAGAEGAAFDGFGGAVDGDSEAAADFVFGPSVTCHILRE